MMTKQQLDVLHNQTLILSDYQLLEHDTNDHPENAGRLKAILEALEEGPYAEHLVLTKRRKATKEEISLVHDRIYVDKILSLDGFASSIDSETLLSPGSVKAAQLAAGLGIELVEQVVLGNVRNGFALLRPPGHHARPSVGMGFCIFNNIAIAAKKALSMGLERILILDWDVHHGNGTQEVFYEDERVLFIDIHQENLFPINSGLIEEVGGGKGRGFTVNIPLPAECGDEEYLFVFDEIVKPFAKKYRPQLILVSAGFDAHESDPLGFMKVTSEGFARLAGKVKILSNELCEGKLVFFLEGGYNPFFLSKNVLQCVKVLESHTVPFERKVSMDSANLIKKVMEKVYAAHFQ